MKYYPKLGVWRVADESEVIKVGGFDFDGKTLVQGHLYMGTDMLIGSEIVRKHDDFLNWGKKVFSLAKSRLHRSAPLKAYVADDAVKWEREGGRYASLVFPGRNPLYDKSPSRPNEA